jgi:biotin synthase-like enzyme
MTEIRNNWTKEEIAEIYHTPLLDLIYRSASVHRENKDYAEVQISSLISIKTGGCPEDCAYCPQAARYNTGVDVHAIMPKEEVIAVAERAKAGGASRLCMGAAWREVRDNRDFDKVIEMVKAVNTKHRRNVYLMQVCMLITITWILLKMITNALLPPELMMSACKLYHMCEKQKFRFAAVALLVWAKRWKTVFLC